MHHYPHPLPKRDLHRSRHKPAYRVNVIMDLIKTQVISVALCGQLIIPCKQNSKVRYFHGYSLPTRI